MKPPPGAELIQHFRASGRSSSNTSAPQRGTHPTGPPFRAEPIKQFRAKRRNSSNTSPPRGGAHQTSPRLRAEPWMKPPPGAEIMRRSLFREPSGSPARRQSSNCPEQGRPLPPNQNQNQNHQPGSQLDPGRPGARAVHAGRISLFTRHGFGRTGRPSHAPVSAKFHRCGGPAGTNAPVSRRRGAHGFSASPKGRWTSHGNGIIPVISSTRAGQLERLFRAA